MIITLSVVQMHAEIFIAFDGVLSPQTHQKHMYTSDQRPHKFMTQL